MSMALDSDWLFLSYWGFFLFSFFSFIWTKYFTFITQVLDLFFFFGQTTQKKIHSQKIEKWLTEKKINV